MEKYSNEESHVLQNIGITLMSGCIRDLNIKVHETKKLKLFGNIYLQLIICSRGF